MRNEACVRGMKSGGARRRRLAVPLFCAAAAMTAVPLLAADAPLVPLQVESTTLSAQSLMLNRAISELRAEPNYTWTATVSYTDPLHEAPGAKGAHNFAYPSVQGSTDSTGLTEWVEAASSPGATHEFIVQGQVAIARIEGEWKAADINLMRDRIHYADLPGDAVLLMHSVLNLQKNDDGSFSGTLTDKAASDLVMTQRVQPPKLLLAGEVALPGLAAVVARYGVPKATVEFDVSNGVLVKQIVRLGFAKTSDTVAPKTSWTQTIAFTELGTTKMTIPDEARKLLATLAPEAENGPVAAAPARVESPANNDSRDFRTRGSRDRRGSSGYNGGSSGSDRGGEPPIALPAGFEVLAHKSIFEKDRTAWVAPRPRDTSLEVYTPRPAPPPPPPKIPVLVGVLIGDTDYMAYIEDPDSGTLWPVAVGDSLPGGYGTVKKVTLKSIEIVKDGAAPRQIAVGDTLAGQAPPPPSIIIPSSASVATPSVPEPPLPKVNVNDPKALEALTVEERMRLRRVQELQGQQ